MTGRACRITTKSSGVGVRYRKVRVVGPTRYEPHPFLRTRRPRNLYQTLATLSGIPICELSRELYIDITVADGEEGEDDGGFGRGQEYNGLDHEGMGMLMMMMLMMMMMVMLTKEACTIRSQPQ